MMQGVVLLLLASFTFALSTVFLKIAVAPPYDVSPSVATFARFSVGFVIFSASLRLTGLPLRPNNTRTVIVRAVLNTLAVIFFFAGIKYTTVTKANILNLTYPAFVFLIAPFMTGERQKRSDYTFLFTTLFGAGMIVLSGGNKLSFSGVNIGDLLALASGVVAGFAISGLREACKFDRPEIILSYQMAFGTIVTFLLMLPSFKMPEGMGLVHVLITAVLSNVGQYFLTRGYGYISAARGSIVLESGILFAAILGISIFQDPLTPGIVAGGLLILASIAGISGRRSLP